jgi:hypothetical protein
MKFVLPLFIIFLSCSHIRQSEVKIYLPAKGELKGMKTPEFILPDPPNDGMKEVVLVFQAYANTDEFYTFARPKLTTLAGGNSENPDQAIKEFRHCLNTRKSVRIKWGEYSGEYRTRVYGGWTGNYLSQNPHVSLNPIKLAGHWMHEITHACGFTHVDNDILKFPIIKESFPYQIGDLFEDYLWKKTK